MLLSSGVMVSMLLSSGVMVSMLPSSDVMVSMLLSSGVMVSMLLSSGVMVSMLLSSGVMDSICSSQVWYIVGSSPNRVKPKTIKLLFVYSSLSMQHSGEREKTGWLGI
jgi:hypothetical protein